MSSSKRKSPTEKTQQKDYSNFLDSVEIEIVPGIRIPMKSLRTEKGRQEAESLRRVWLRQNRNPFDYVRPETLKVNKRLWGCVQTFFGLDAQMFLYTIAKQITQAASYPLGTGEHPDAPSVIVERAREILHETVNRELNAFISQLIDDVLFETILSLDGEIKLNDGRADLKKEWYRRASERVEKKHRRIFRREGLFHTRHLLREAILEAIEEIRRKDPGREITQSLVVQYFSETEKYRKCGDESSLRRWLRRHRVESWDRLIEELLQEHKIRSLLRCKG